MNKEDLKIEICLKVDIGNLNENHIFIEDMNISEIKTALVEVMKGKLDSLLDDLDESFINDFEARFKCNAHVETNNEMRRRLKKRKLNVYEKRIEDLIKEFNGELQAVSNDLLNLARERSIISPYASTTESVNKFKKTLSMLIEAEIITFKDGKYIVE